MDASSLMAKVYELLTVYGIKVIAAIVIFIVGRWVAKAIANFIKKLMTKSNTDETLVKFVGSLCYIALLAFVIIAALNREVDTLEKTLGRLQQRHSLVLLPVDDPADWNVPSMGRVVSFAPVITITGRSG